MKSSVSGEVEIELRTPGELRSAKTSRISSQLALATTSLSSKGLSSQVFGFYFYRRMLEDLYDWIHRILYENISYEQDKIDLQGVHAHTIGGWDTIEPSIQKVAEVVQKNIGDRYENPFDYNLP